MRNFLNKTKFPVTTILKAVCFWVIFIVLLMAAGLLNNMILPVEWHHLSYGILGTVTAFITTIILLKVERKSFADYGIIWQRNSILNFLKGFLIGVICFAIVFIILIITTSLTIESANNVFSIGILFSILSIFFMAFMEEIAFRAYPFLLLHKTIGLRATQIIVAIAFALYHIAQGWNVEVAFLGPGIWAFVFGLGAVWSKGIAMPTGIHMALNVLQEFMGTKGNSEHAFYVLKQQNNSPLAVAHIQTVGIAVQLLVLVVAIIFTEWAIRKNRNASNQ